MSTQSIAKESAPHTVATKPKPRSLRQLLLYGGAMLGLAVGVERILAFLSAMLAARIGGPQTFGAYAVVLATAGTIAAYAGAGIGTTATRFSGDYPQESAGYPGFLRALIIIGVSSAVLAALLMFAGAGPLARWMLRNDGLTVVLRLAAISSAAMVLLECCRGLLLGQQKFYSLLALSLVSGLPLIIALPMAARINAAAMVAVQGCVALVTVAFCVSFLLRFGIRPVRANKKDKGPGVRPVLSFGLIQFSAFAGVSIATWCIASLVARSDPSLTQMGFYAVSNQFRGLAAILPGLLTQVVYSSLTNDSGARYGGAQRVLLASTILTTLFVTSVAGLAMIAMPWIVRLAYGRSYLAAEIPAYLLLATAIIHMGGQAGAQRLSIVRLSTVGVINGTWAVLLIALGFFLIPARGAVGAAIAFLAAHTISFTLVTVSLYREKVLPAGYLTTTAALVLSAFVLAALGYARATHTVHMTSLTFWMASFWIAALLAVALIAIKNGFLSDWLARGRRQSPAVPSLSEI